MNSPVQAPAILQMPQFSTVAALLAADESTSGSEQSGQSGQDRRSGQGGRGGQGNNRGRGGQNGQGRGGQDGQGRGGQDGQGQGGPGGPGGRRGQSGQGDQGRGRGGQGGQGGGRDRMGPGRSSGGGGGQRQSANQTQPLDWATFSRIFDQITLTDNTTISGQININTVGVDVLRAFLEGNEDLANKIIAYRESMGGEITNVCDLMNINGMTQSTLSPYLDQFCVRSSVYTIRVTAQSSSCGVRYFMETVVNRDREGRDVLYKLEGVGS